MMPANSVKLKLLLAVLVILLFWQSSKLFSSYTLNQEALIEKQSNNQQILVTVYYEALCPDSKNFIRKQLVPTFDSMENYIELQLIPYGKAKTIVTDNDFQFECQHGPTECEANIIHGCSVNKISDSRKQLDLIACMINNNANPLKALNDCGSSLSEYNRISECSQSLEGRRLLSKYGQVTDELNPKVRFIPTITLDNSMDDQPAILKDLKGQICQRFENKPSECYMQKFLPR